jgi:hypothetical protein
MKTTAYSLEDLRKEFGKNKKIPQKYEAAILTALSHYPELKDIKINFTPVQKHKVPYGTTPALHTLLNKPESRQYNVTILEEAKGPMRQALLKNLPIDAQVGVMGHEIAHVLQYHNMSRGQLLGSLVSYLQPSFQRKIERGADLATILHGLGKQLLEQAIYIRSIPGYVQQRKSINTNYLKPKEIRQYMKSNDFFEKHQLT